MGYLYPFANNRLYSHMLNYFNYSLIESLDEIQTSSQSQRPVVVNCLNPHSFVIALQDTAFRAALEQSDYLLPDGEGICMTLKRYKGQSVQKVAGDDLHRYMLDRLSKCNGRVFYMGSNEMVLKRIVDRLKLEYPTLTVETFSPSYCDELPKEESDRIVETVNAFAPDLLLVSMTAPKQEKWVCQYAHQLSTTKMVASIGAVFDFYAGTVKRAPRWAVALKLEWLVRLLKEPQRMWRRNFVSTPQFLRWVHKHRKEM